MHCQTCQLVGAAETLSLLSSHILLLTRETEVTERTEDSRIETRMKLRNIIGLLRDTTNLLETVETET